jgi:hypothetical protein
MAKPKPRSAEKAPAPAVRSHAMRGNKTQITLTIAPELLDQLDVAVRAEHLSRSALLIMLINEWLRRRRG